MGVRIKRVSVERGFTVYLFITLVADYSWFYTKMLSKSHYIQAKTKFWLTYHYYYSYSYSYYYHNRIYNKILDRDWFSARLFVT